MQDVTVVITTHLRPVALKQCLRAVRIYYPDIPIIVLTDEKLTMSATRAIRDANALLIEKLTDCGLAEMRNEGVSLAETPYVMIVDDDVMFLDDTCLECLKSALEHGINTAVAAGSLIYAGVKKNFINKLNIYKERKEYEIIPIDEPEWIKRKDGAEYCYADYVFNFFLLRKSAGLRWDSKLKIGIEHIDFFIRLKLNHPEWKAIFVPSVIANHKDFSVSKRYFSDRKRKEFWQVYSKDAGFARGINLNSKSVYYLEEGRSMSYPEYVFFLLNSNRNVSREALKKPIQPARMIGG